MRCIYNINYYEKNRERLRAKARDRYTANREVALAYRAEYYAKNGEICRERTNRYRNSEQGKIKRIEHTLRQMAQ